VKTKNTSKQKEELGPTHPDEKALKDIEELNKAMTADFTDLYLERKPEKST
jgi:hypothetical protein